MHTDSPKVLSTIANILALSPGTMAVDATDSPPVLFVHVFTDGDIHDVRRRVASLERLVIEAIGSAADRRAVNTESGVRN
jgi:multicomponent Na+:H+ antiporter subunit E